jgi:ceramide glucosyltransferase
MDPYWLIAYLALLGLALAQVLVLGLQTFEHRRYARSCMRGLDRHRPTGRAAVFAPCKGMDVDLEGNLRALLCQDYPDYEVTFIVESADDPAVEVIRRVAARSGRVDTRLVMAGKASHSGQKVHNLRAGTASLSPDIEYLAFIDSDARPRPEWLRVLIGQLHHAHTGAVTGYRWYIPARDSLANSLLYSMNCEIMALLGYSSHYLIWGGSWGIRRAVFDSVGLHSAWAGTLSDDLVATRQLRQRHRHVRFEPGCVVASPLDCSLREMLSFVRRQYLVARFYIPDLWALAFLAGAVAQLSWLANLAVLGWSLIWGALPGWIPACGCALLYLLGAYRGWLRQDLVRTYFPDQQENLRKACWFDIWASPLAKLIHWLGLLSSPFGRHIGWRGISYRVFSGGGVRIVSRDGQAEEDDQQPEIPTRRLVRYRKAG